MFDNNQEYGGGEQLAETERSFEGKASDKKMSMFAEFFANHQNLKKAANAATLFLILTKGLLMVDSAQAAEKPHLGGMSDPKALEFIDDVKTGAMDFEKIALPEGMNMVFKDHLSAPDDKASHEKEGALGDSGKNLLVSSYAGSANEYSWDDHHKMNGHEQLEVVTVIGEAGVELEPGVHSDNIHGYGDTKEVAIANALSHFSQTIIEGVNAHSYSSDTEKEHYHGNHLGASLGDHISKNIVETKTSSYISSYEVVEVHEEDGGKFVKVTVNVTGGLPAEKIVNAE